MCVARRLHPSPANTAYVRAVDLIKIVYRAIVKNVTVLIQKRLNVLHKIVVIGYDMGV